MSIPIATTIESIRLAVSAARGQGRRIGLVPTMGALHEGHASLIRLAASKVDWVVVSIFVNPTQFAPGEDFDRYPRTLEADAALCADAGASAIFAPNPREIYPKPLLTWVEVDELGKHLCGPSRPGHFRGVATVVLKLFNIVLPDVAVFGAKDAQQLRIIQRMVIDLNVPTLIEVGPTVREADGLALSSRNRYLSLAERSAAPGIHRALHGIRARVAAGETDAERLRSALEAELIAIPGARVDYASIVDDATLQPIAKIEAPALAAVAVVLGKTRLIDNITLP